MQISLDENKSAFMIQRYQPGEIKINDLTYTHSVIITPTQLIETWPPQSVDDIKESDLDKLKTLSPSLVIIGTGEKQHFLPPSLLVLLTGAGIGVEVMSTQAACRTFNVLMAEDRKAVAALIL